MKKKIINYYNAFYKSPIGILKITATDRGICAVDFISEEHSEEIDFNIIPEQLNIAINQIDEYFNFKRKLFELDIDYKGTAFQILVWKKLLEIPYNTLMTYSEFSEVVRNQESIRAVASANSKNPIPIIVPCHRVIGVNKKLVGYSGGLWRKEWLINFENGIIQKSLFD